MKTEQKYNVSFDELDEITRPSPDLVEFEDVANRMVSRRGFLGSGAAVGAGAFVGRKSFSRWYRAVSPCV